MRARSASRARALPCLSISFFFSRRDAADEGGDEFDANRNAGAACVNEAVAREMAPPAGEPAGPACSCQIG